MTQQLPRRDRLELSKSGEHKVGVQTLHLNDDSRQRPIITEIWYPAQVDAAASPSPYENIPWHQLKTPVSFAGNAFRDAVPLTDAKRSVILYAHGAPGSRLQSTYLCEHLASHGYVVAAIDFTLMTYGDMEPPAYVSGLIDRPKDVSFVLDELANSATYGAIIEVAQTLFIGYSFGGYTGLAAAGAGLDFEQLAANASREDDFGYPMGFREVLEPARGKQLGWQGDGRIKALFIMAPWNGPVLDLPQVSVPTFIAVGELDVVAPLERDARRMYDGISSEEKHLLIFERAGHNIFTNPVLPEARSVQESWDHSSDAVWDKERVNDIIKHAALAFSWQQLDGKDVSSYLTKLEKTPALIYKRA